MSDLADELLNARDAYSSGDWRDVIGQLKTDGHPVVINKTGNAPLGDCTVIAISKTRHEHHGGAQSDAFNTAYVDLNCIAK
jgi:hypothetical protein